MRIAFDVRKLNDFGIGTYIHNLVLNLAQLDHQSEYLLIGHDRDRSELGALPANFSFLFDRTHNSGFWNDFVLPYRLGKLGIDILHTPHYRSPRMLRCKSVITIHDCGHILFPNYASSKAAHDQARKATRRSIKQASHILTVSEATQRDLIRLFSVPEDKITVVYNAIDERAVLPSDLDEQKRVLERYQIQDLFLLYAGNIKPHKNIARLIEAFSVLKAELKDNEAWKNLKLFIVGDELSKHQFLRRTVIRSGVQHDVRFFGYVPYETLKVFYKSAEIFVFPSLYEGFGLPPLEAMANGTPVLTSNVSSLPEVMGNAALLVNPENVFEICKGLKRLLFDSNFRAELIARGIEQSRLYSWKKSAELVLQTYRKVAMVGHC
ncbi:MAG: glycosyltransferase family 4 protein [Acidimicrobiia bacterium]|nr:glycosyltransferase family 4 protein [Acidimicrobiia bacterium]